MLATPFVYTQAEARAELLELTRRPFDAGIDCLRSQLDRAEAQDDAPLYWRLDAEIDALIDGRETALEAVRVQVNAVPVLVSETLQALPSCDILLPEGSAKASPGAQRVTVAECLPTALPSLLGALDLTEATA